MRNLFCCSFALLVCTKHVVLVVFSCAFIWLWFVSVIRLPNLITMNICFLLANYGDETARLCVIICCTIDSTIICCVLCCLSSGLSYLLWAFCVYFYCQESSLQTKCSQWKTLIRLVSILLLLGLPHHDFLYVDACPIDSRGQSKKKSIQIVNGMRKAYAESVLLNMVSTYYSWMCRKAHVRHSAIQYSY